MSDPMSDPNIRPRVEKVTGVPTCTREECPSYDGKRCRMIGHRPDGICEPAVIGYVVALRKAKSQVEALDGAINYALGALLAPSAPRRAAAIAAVSERVHQAHEAADAG